MNSLSKYDLDLLRVNTDHRRLVDSYTFMLLGKDGAKYFRVDVSDSQKRDFYSIMAAAMASHYDDEEEQL